MNEFNFNFPEDLNNKLAKRSQLIQMMMNYIFVDNSEANKIAIAHMIQNDDMFKEKTILVTGDELIAIAIEILKAQWNSHKENKPETSTEDTDIVG